MAQAGNRGQGQKSGQSQNKQQGGQGQGGGRPDGGFKSRMCKFWEAGTCRQGSACSFAHSSDEVVKRRGGGGGGGGGNNNRRDGGRDGGNRGGGGGGGNRQYHHNNNNQNREAFVLPERPQVALPNLNEGKSAADIELAARREGERLVKQKEFVDKFLEEIKYDESVMHED